MRIYFVEFQIIIYILFHSFNFFLQGLLTLRLFKILFHIKTLKFKNKIFIFKIIIFLVFPFKTFHYFLVSKIEFKNSKYETNSIFNIILIIFDMV